MVQIIPYIPSLQQFEKHLRDKKWRRLFTIVLLMLISISSFPNCGKPPDQKAYEEVIATMSMAKARTFFEKYPESQYRERLINQIIEWCKQENTESCYKIIIEVIPKDHPRHKEVVNHIEKQFGGKN